MELPDEIQKKVLELSHSEKEKIEDDVEAVMDFFEGLATHFGFSQPVDVMELAKIAGFLDGGGGDILKSLRSFFEKPRKASSLLFYGQLN